MEQHERYLRTRMEAIVDAWLKASPAERSQLLREKLRLQLELEELRHRSPSAL